MDSKKIGTFKQFLKEQRMKKINEERLDIEVSWWDECIVEVMKDLKDACNGMLDYDSLVKYVKSKFQILGREEPGYDEGLILYHIKDLIFYHHGDSLYFNNGGCNLGGDHAETQAKGLVVGELANVILDKVMDTIKTSDDPIPGITSASLIDKQPKTLAPDEDEYCEDLPFGYESHHVRPVKGFNDYTKPLNETVAMIDCDSQEECIQFVLGVVQKMVGSLDAGEIAIKAYQVASTEVKTDLVVSMLKSIVYDYLSNQKGQVKIVGIGDPKDVKENVPEDVFEQGLDILCDEIADEILGRLAKENGEGHEEV